MQVSVVRSGSLFKHVLGRLQARGGVYMFCKTHVKLGGNTAIMGTSLVPMGTSSSLIFRLTSVFCDTDRKGPWKIGEGVAFLDVDNIWLDAVSEI